MLLTLLLSVLIIYVALKLWFRGRRAIVVLAPYLPAWVTKEMAKNLRQPGPGFFGWLAKSMLNKGNIPICRFALSLLELKPKDRVLELGYGPGLLVQMILSQQPDAFVAGIDFSQDMVDEANARNAEAVKAKQADLRFGDVAKLPFNDDDFHSVVAVNCHYFWSDPQVCLKEIRRVMKPGAKLALVGADPDQMKGNAITSNSEFKYLINANQLESMLREAGFETVSTAKHQVTPQWSSVYAIATK